MLQKPYIPDTSGFNKNTRFRCIQKKNTSELHKSRQSRCISSLQVYQNKQPALPHTSNSKRISAQIIVNPAGAGVCCEGEWVYSREINWNTSGLGKNLEFRCILFVLPACAGVCCEREQVYSWEINWNTSGLEENLDFRCILFWQLLAIHRK